ncbi:MAG: glycyl-radical enzyme activating protein [Anaerolinea sp.]|nr:glycyl-radical enzyme activating protein [Anaerolinea sp.]
MRGVVFNIQRFTLHDGPGIRTTVFLKGCPLRCVWCHNPEAMSPEPETSSTGQPFGALMTADEVLAVIAKDRRYYDNSGGGVTFSGGEPLFQFKFTLELAERAKAAGLHVAIDTAGFAPQRHYEQILPYVDLFLYDIKADSGELHRALTGVSNDLILRNLDALMTYGARVRLRCPLVPGVNDHADHLRFIAGLAARYPALDGIDLMPFHNLAAGKWHAVNKTWTLGEVASATTADQARWLDFLRAAGCTNATIG